MESNDLMQEKILWYEKRNSYMRIGVIVLLLAILGSIVYYKYGTPPNLEDQKMIQELTDGSNYTIIDCRGALIYYYENAIKAISNEKANDMYERFNVSIMNKYLANLS